MKFTNYLKEIDNVSIFPIITLVLFVSIFIVAVLYCFVMDKDTALQSSQMPLDESEILFPDDKINNYE
ncbi:hypothetical protein [Membranihabitans maritimus]|uniref:hypothetical protein n=1 Tax=Membranihabitans maritimus TaxID=2904244 RepID=UPI001F3B0AF9|nr:hypothetical protein [Membranihabitans maritimus]